MTHLTFSTRLRATTKLGLAAAIATMATIALSGTASAQQAELPVNALAPEITTEADLAVAAYETFTASEDLADYLVYAAHRTATARLAARELGYNEFAMIDSWKNSTLDHQRAVLAAMTQIGVPYRTNTSVEDEGFDCSGLTSYAWQESGVELQRISGAQIRNATEVDRASAMAGDLVHYPGHVMMYLGVDNAVVHSVNTGRTVEIDTISRRSVNRVTFGDPSA
jgi:cell wall-associated NlpC family hydrolase